VNHREIQRALHALSKEGYHLVNTPIEVDIKPSDEKDYTAQEQKTRPRKELSAEEQHPAEHPQEQPAPKWKRILAALAILKRWKTWKRFLFVAGIFGGVAYSWITYKQWHDLRHHFEIEQRSWIKAGWDWSVFPNVQGLYLQFTNFGKHPALESQMVAILEVIESGSHPTFSFKNRPVLRDRMSLIFPGDTTRLPDPIPLMDSQAKPRKLTADEARLLSAGKAYVAIWGVVIYRDDFGDHWTRFCDWKPFPLSQDNLPYDAQSCISWNSVGDGKYPEDK
jgi:hypothetical protein